jgi:lysophospholipase L1-like esterase
MAALGDSISAGWGSAVGVHGGNLAGANVAGSWATGDDTRVRSHFERLSGDVPIVAVNLARPGVRIGDPVAGGAAQAGAVPLGTEYVAFGGGTSDVCAPGVTAPSEITTVARFAAAFRATLTRLHRRLPRARVLVTSIPDWYQLRAHPALARVRRPAYACPLLFGHAATEETARVVQRSIREYNRMLRKVCEALASFCRSDQGAVHRLRLTRADLSTVDHFHFNLRGQARVAAASWAAGWYAREGAPAGAGAGGPRVARVPPLRPVAAPRLPAPAVGRRIALVSATVRVDHPARLTVTVRDASTRTVVPLLTGSVVGGSRAAEGRTALVGRGIGSVPIRLRLPLALLARRQYVVEVTAVGRGGTSTLDIPVPLVAGARAPAPTGVAAPRPDRCCAGGAVPLPAGKS